MDTSLTVLLAQRDALQQQIATAQREAKASALAEIRRLMLDHGLTTADIARDASRGTAQGKPRTRVAPKYRDPASGATWSGRGLKPKWLTAALGAGNSIDDFVI